MTIGVVLIGGSSSRMGTPKAFLRLPDSHGRTFLENALGLLLGLTDRQLVAGGAQDADNRADIAYLRVDDLRPGEGPLAGMEAALATGSGTGYLIIACDQPNLTEELLQRLLDGDAGRIHAFIADLEFCQVFRPDRTPNIVPLPVYLPQSALTALRQALDGGIRAVRPFLAVNNPELIRLEPDQIPKLQSINTPEEYQQLFRHN